MKVSVNSTAPILAYCASSITMTLVNRYLMQAFKPYLFFMLSIQAGACVLLIHIFRTFKLVNAKAFNLEDAKKWLPVSVLTAVMLYTGAQSQSLLDVAITTIYKNLTIVLIAYGEKFMFGTHISMTMLASFGLIVLSSIIGGFSEIKFNFIGYIWMIFNCFATACYVLFMRKAIRTVSFRDFDTVYFNNLITLPIFLTLSLMTESLSTLWGTLINNEDENNILLIFQIGVVVSGISAFAISYCSAWCIRAAGATTYSMVGALNKLPVSFAGIVFLGEQTTTGNVCAIILAFLSGLVYSKAKMEAPKPAPVSNRIPTYEELQQEDELELLTTMKNVIRPRND